METVAQESWLLLRLAWIMAQGAALLLCAALLVPLGVRRRLVKWWRWL